MRNELISAAAEQLSADYACEPGDFFAKKNKATVSRLVNGRRIFKNEPDFFKMASLGESVVASVSAELYPFAKDLLARFDTGEPQALFDSAQLFLINGELRKHHYAIGINSIFFLPKTPYKYIPKSGFHIRVYDEPAIRSVLYRFKGYHNALLYNAEHEKRRDVSAVCAFNGSSIAGIAGASGDSERFWQVGIDVLPEYRAKGLAADLVSAITQEVFMRGAVPYYSTWGGNIPSQRVALKCGYYPAWTEVVATYLMT